MARKKGPLKEPSKYLTAVPSGNGRPKLILNSEGQQLVEILAGYFCTDEDIAETMHTTVDTLLNRNNRDTFLECKKRGIANGRCSLRRKQAKLAEKSAAMAIFLGKNYLGQSDYPDYDDNEDVQRRANLQVTTIAEQLKNAVPAASIDDLLAEADAEPELEAGEGV